MMRPHGISLATVEGKVNRNTYLLSFSLRCAFTLVGLYLPGTKIPHADAKKIIVLHKQG